MPIETREEVYCSQKRIENFSRRAYEMMVAVETLEDAFIDLDDQPENIREAMSQLSAIGDAIATDALSWARTSNANFDPSGPFGFFRNR